MKAHLAYLWYVLRHKWFVFLEACQLGIPWLGLIHDWSKFLPCEWFPYVHTFYSPDGSPRKIRDETGYYDPSKVCSQLDYGWLHHQHVNKHHWQYWVVLGDEDKTLPVPVRYLHEMLADWRGASRAQGKASVEKWYEQNRSKINLRPEDLWWIDCQIMRKLKVLDE